MHRRHVLVLVLAAAALLGGGCSFFDSIGLAPNQPDPERVRVPADERREPDHVAVRHVLISFEGAGVPGVTRTRAEAERLAQRVHELARSGRDFGELVRLYSDDRHGNGTYELSNWGVLPRADEMEREKMVRGFGAAAFSLEPGQIALVPWDKTESPLGWHLIRRER